MWDVFCSCDSGHILIRQNKIWDWRSQGICCLHWKPASSETPLWGLSMGGRQWAVPGVWKSFFPSLGKIAMWLGPTQEHFAGCRFCVGIRTWAQDMNLVSGKQWNWEQMSCCQIHKWIPKREKKCIKSGTSYTMYLTEMWDLNKCFQRLKIFSLCSMLRFILSLKIFLMPNKCRLGLCIQTNSDIQWLINPTTGTITIISNGASRSDELMLI